MVIVARAPVCAVHGGCTIFWGVFHFTVSFFVFRFVGSSDSEITCSNRSCACGHILLCYQIQPAGRRHLRKEGIPRLFKASQRSTEVA
ncbi:hypothetical protein GDO78_004705 [Eleutherodactylus coqui]|uniref:Uncharacterized protein n=1 Tax=Eleutherodactylus coqui TaxID=57060 RepID=A0A8J6K074_ELECQ|nr:hypothetical protein GDO78_004705 [Eleutherodactylus coqui]